MNVWPLVYDSDSFQLGSYGVILVVAVLASLSTAALLCRRDNLPSGKVIDLGVACLFLGLLGSKLLGIAVAVSGGASVGWSDLRNAGAVHGGLLAGFIALIVLTRKNKFSLSLILDAFLPGIALGQAIGRLGCLAAGCCFGTHTELPWAVTYTHEKTPILGGAPLHLSVHPVQIYDFSAHVLFMALLIVLHRRKILRGRLISFWCIGEGIMRFSIETFRGDLARGIWFNISWLSTGRLTALLFILLGVLFYFTWPTAKLENEQAA